MKKYAAVIVVLFASSMTPGASAQECVKCQPGVRLLQGRQVVVRRWQETEMQSQKQLVEIDVEVPVVRTYETREVFETRERRKRGGVNWGCVAVGVQAFVNCNYSKRQARRQRRSGGKLGGFFGRLLSVFRNR
tara:strand:- start:1815 stop:2213 length:399 start_codon:yes stop_codon:yes gene_type:complete